MTMKTLGIVPLLIDGQSYSLQFTWAAIDMIESHFSVPAWQALEKIDEHGTGPLKVFLHAGLQQHHPDLDVDALIQRANPPIGICSQAIGEAVGYAYTGPAEVKETTPAKKPRPRKSRKKISA